MAAKSETKRVFPQPESLHSMLFTKNQDRKASENRGSARRSCRGPNSPTERNAFPGLQQNRQSSLKRRGLLDRSRPFNKCKITQQILLPATCFTERGFPANRKVLTLPRSSGPEVAARSNGVLSEC